MATTGLVNGTLVSLYKDVSGVMTKIANGTSADFEMTKDTIDATNKDGGNYKEFLVGLNSWTMSFEGIFEEDGSVASGHSAKDIITDLVAGALIQVVMTTNVTGDMKLSGSALLTNFAWSAPVNDVSTFSCSLQGSGTLTVGTVA
jgi:TP901-1 family phage major tail protein